MKLLFLLIIVFLPLSVFSAQLELFKITPPKSLALAASNQTNFPMPAPAPELNLNFNHQALPSKNDDQTFGSVGEFVYSVIFMLDALVKKQTLWNPTKGLIIPLAIKKNPVQIMPSLNYNFKDNQKNKYILKAYLVF